MVETGLVKLKRSIKTQLVISFFAVMLPIVIFLVANNWYAKKVVQDKVSETYINTLDIFVGQTDRSFREINEYLYKMAVLDSDVGLLMSYPNGSDQYVLTKVRIQNKINRDVGFYNLIDTVFLYHEGDILYSTSSHYSDVKTILNRNVTGIIESKNSYPPSKWLLREDSLVPGYDFLVNILEVTEGLYVGAVINISDIQDLLSIQWDDGAIGESTIYRRNGDRLIESLSERTSTISLENQVLPDAPYNQVTSHSTGERFMVMNRFSEMADISINIIIPESYMLQGLPYFQKAAYFIALGIILIFSLYLIFIRLMVFKPLQQLITGMKKISLGMLDVRLHTNETVEFIFLANTFNNMAEQIKTLKIGMYEEQLRGQKIELKQLQAQINPHFYMNSLNIIYNFAALKDHDSVKRMALHLADYFRFIMRMNRDLISLEEELKHIDNYIEIQKFRFPDKLHCEFDIPERLKPLLLPALSLQPFVENAIIHGFANRKKLFRITIRGNLITDNGDPYLSLSVKDNGVGFSAEILECLNEGGPLPPSETSRFGILNVIQRLKLRYGGEADIGFENDAESGGAAVRIRLPLADKEEKETDV